MSGIEPVAARIDLGLLRNGVVLLALIALPNLVGCDAKDSKPKPPETIKGLQETLAARDQQIEDLKHRIETLQKENEQKLLDRDDYWKRKLTDKDSVIADLRLELSMMQREKLTLQEIVDQRPRIQEAVRARFGLERMVWMVLVLLPCAALLIIASRYLALRTRMRPFIISRASVAGIPSEIEHAKQ